jgi:YkoP domain
MNVELSEKHAGSWVSQAVFALDRLLRRRQGINEFSARPECVFRIELSTADRALVLSDGTRVRPGDPLIKLHIWNEHLPRMGRNGPSMGWARQVSRVIDGSLAELSSYLARRPDLAGVRVLYGEMCLATPRQTERFKRVVAHYGFEEEAHPESDRRGVLRRIGDTILVLLLVLATNPASVRRALRRYQRRIYLSRAALDARYGQARRGGRPPLGRTHQRSWLSLLPRRL